MDSNLKTNWPVIVKLIQKIRESGGYCTIATVCADGSAHATPIGSLVLNDDGSGYFSDGFLNKMTKNLANDQRVCIMAARADFWFWLKAIISGRFQELPGVRLYGSVGQRRKAEPGEIERWRKRWKRFKWTKGYKLLWKNIDTVRDVRFTHFDPVRAGTMTRHLTNSRR